MRISVEIPLNLAIALFVVLAPWAIIRGSASFWMDVGYDRSQLVIRTTAVTTDTRHLGRTEALVLDPARYAPNLAEGNCRPRPIQAVADAAAAPPPQRYACMFKATPGHQLHDPQTHFPIWILAAHEWGLAIESGYWPTRYFGGFPDGSELLFVLLMLPFAALLAWLGGWRPAHERGMQDKFATVGGVCMMLAPSVAAACVVWGPSILAELSQAAVHPPSWAPWISQQAYETNLSGVDPATKWSRGLRVLLLTPLVEEALYRAGILALLLTRFRPAIAVLISALSFALPHPYEFMSNLGVFVSGIFLGIAWLRTRSLLFCALAHMLINLGVGARVILS